MVIIVSSGSPIMSRDGVIFIRDYSNEEQSVFTEKIYLLLDSRGDKSLQDVYFVSHMV